MTLKASAKGINVVLQKRSPRGGDAQTEGGDVLEVISISSLNTQKIDYNTKNEKNMKGEYILSNLMKVLTF